MLLWPCRCLVSNDTFSQHGCRSEKRLFTNIGSCTEKVSVVYASPTTLGGKVHLDFHSNYSLFNGATNTNVKTHAHHQLSPPL
jgi:hypothetical protein